MKPIRGAVLNRAHPLSRGLIGVWLFNEGTGNKAFDFSRGNHGTLVNMVPGWCPGGNGFALEFDGATSKIVHGLELPKQAGTILSSVYPRLRDRMVCVYESGGTGLNYDGWGSSQNLLEIHTGSNTDGTWCFNYQDGGASSRIVVSGSTVLPLNAWSTTGVSWNRSRDINIYVNGAPDGSGDISGISFTSKNATQKQIGMHARSSATRKWNGLVGDCFIYDRELASAEVLQHHINPYAMFATEAHPWLFGLPTVGPVIGHYFYGR